MVLAARVDVKEHAASMLSELHRMRQDCNHCDLIIKVQSDVYRVHKNVLSAGSEYFRAMLAHDTIESRDGEISFKDVDSECVKTCIDFIYSGEFEIQDGKIKDLLHVGVMLQLDGVKQVISGILMDSMSVENYYSTRDIADTYNLDNVTSKCQTFFKENLMPIASLSEFAGTSISRLVELLLSKELKYSDQEKLTILLKWAEKNPQETGVLLDAMKRLRLDKISAAFLRSLLKSHVIVSNDLAIYKMISDHLLDTAAKVIQPKDAIICANCKRLETEKSKVEKNLSDIKNQLNESKAQGHSVFNNTKQKETATLLPLPSSQIVLNSQKQDTKQYAVAEVTASGTNSVRHKSRGSSDRSKTRSVAESLVVRLITNPCNFESIQYKTHKKEWAHIREQGIRCDSESCIKFTVFPGEGYTASDTGHAPDVYIHIDVKKAVIDGLKFYVSSKNVVFSKGLRDGIIAPKYFKHVLAYDYKTQKFKQVDI